MNQMQLISQLLRRTRKCIMFIQKAAMDAITSVSKGCFVYKNGTTVKHSNKCRKSANPYEGLASQQQYKSQVATPLLSDDILRQPFYKVYQQMWQAMKQQMEAIQSENNSRVLKHIVDYVIKHKYGQDIDYQLGEHVLPTAALFTGINQSDHLKLFNELTKQLTCQLSCSVCILQSNDCSTSKQTLENMIYNLLQSISSKNYNNDDDSGLVIDNTNANAERANSKNKRKDIKRSQCTMWHLKQCYYNSMNLSNNPSMKAHLKETSSPHFLIVILADFECFSSVVLQDLIEILSSYCNELPFILIVGVATTVSTIHDMLPYQVTRKIRLDTFQIPSAAMILYEILDKVILSPKYAFHVSGKTLKFLCHIFFHYDYSFTGFMQNFKYCMMEHFIRGNVYSLCSSYDAAAIRNLQYLSQADLEDIRKQLSFRPFVESLNDNKRIIAILTNDEHLRKVELPLLLKQCHIYFTLRHIFLEFLYQLVQDLPRAPLGTWRYELYIHSMSEDIMKLDEYKECWQLMKMLSKDDILRKFKTAMEKMKLLIRNSNHTDIDLNVWQECQIIIQERLNKIEQFLNYIENGVNAENEEKSTSPSNNHHVNQLKNITSRHDLKEKLQQMSKQQKSYTNGYGQVVQQLLMYIENDILRLYIKPEWNWPTLHELFIFTNLDEIKNNLIGTPRAVLHMALNNPYIYLQCKCCELKNSMQFVSTLPDISIVYKLHLECGRMINLYDWLQSFHAIIHDANDLEQHNDKDKAQTEEHENGQIISPQIQARFARAIAELQFLGYIKMSKRKTDHATRLTW